MSLLYLALKNLGRRKLRTSFTFLSIVVAFMLFGYLCAIRHSLSGGITLQGASRLIARHKVSIIQLLPESYKQKIARIPGVQAVTHQTWFGGIYREPKNFFAQMPVVPDEFLAMFPEYLLPEEQKEAWGSTRTGAVIGRKLSERFGWKVGDKIPLLAPIWPRRTGGNTWEFEVVGIFDGKDKNTDTAQLFFRYDYFDEARVDQAKGLIGWYMVRVHNPDEAPALAARIDAEFENSAAETKTETEKAFLQGFAKQIGDIALLTAIIMSAVFFTILLVTGNTMSQSVRERTGEFGVLKAIGFSPAHVLRMVLIESCLLAFLGAAVGIAMAALLITSHGDPTGGMLPLFAFLPSDAGWGAVIGVGLGLVTGMFPALSAMRLRVSDAVRRI